MQPDWWEGCVCVCGGGGGCGGELICLKRVQQSFLNQSLELPNKKFLDPPLRSTPTLLTHHGKKLKLTRLSCAVTWKVFFCCYIIFSGNVNNVAFSVTSILRFGMVNRLTEKKDSTLIWRLLGPNKPIQAKQP